MSGPCLREFIGQANRNIGRKNRSASLEGPLDGLDKCGLAKLECSRNHPEIIEILEPAIGNAEGNESLEFLRHHRFDGIGSKMRRRGVQQGGIVDVDSAGVMASPKPISTWIAIRAPAIVAVVRTRTPPYSISSRIGAAVSAATSNVTPSSATGCAQMARKVSAMASASLAPWPSKSKIASGPERVGDPGHEEHRTFENETVAMR